ncbi:Dps family protein [Burkholderia pseudomallei]|uniref:Dps family protein n=1 Tax=Burkholderia pseudomallei TaxID=28450 RepID=UPI000CDD3AE8|nr:Dps family protein [Burkholderia pseudomallei]
MAKKSNATQINIGISDKDRKKIAAGLSRLLADTYTLYLKTHNFHWNVTGPMFNTLHLMLLSSIPEADGVPAAEEMIRQLVEGHEAVVRTARAIFPDADAASDEPTADLLTQRLQTHEKTAWMLRSLLA